MKNNLRILIVLTGVCLVCGLCLSVVYGLAQDKIKSNQQKDIINSIKIIVPETARVDEAKDKKEVFYKIYNQQNKLIGYGFTAKGKGYGGDIKLMVAVDQNLEQLFGVEVLESQETPGLGAKISNQSFKGQFSDVSLKGDFECVKGVPTSPLQIKAITGATISSKAIVGIVNTKLSKIRTILNGKK
jgi:electron transport complex protein RnfG